MLLLKKKSKENTHLPWPHGMATRQKPQPSTDGLTDG
jgi:hypothetical protein